MPTAVITGANSGIGHALAVMLIKEGYKVIAADINTDGPIAKLGCEVIELDISSNLSIQNFKQKMGKQPVDMLLNVAGIMVPMENDTLEKVNDAKFQKTFAVNTFGPFLLTQTLLEYIFLSPHPRIAVVSSRVGSIGDNHSGGAYSYRASKAAVNALFKNIAVDLKEKSIPVILLHPGIVKSNLGHNWQEGTNADVQGAVEPEVAAKDLWRVLMSKGLESTGKFFHRNGEELPW